MSTIINFIPDGFMCRPNTLPTRTMIMTQRSGLPRFFAAAAGSLLVLAAAWPVRAETMTVTHAQGTAEVEKAPQTILTFDLATLDTLASLGVAVAGIPQIKLPAYLQTLADTPKVGSLFEPDYEAVAAAEPDLIVVATRSAPKLAELARIAPTIDLSTDPAAPLESAARNVRVLAAITGKEAQAEAALARLDASIAALRQTAATAGRGLVVMTTGGRISVYGPGSRFGMIFDDFGVTPADGSVALGTHGQPVSFEYLLETDPDWLFVVDRDAAIGEEGAAAGALLDNPLVAQTTAWKTGQVVYLDSAAWYLVGGGLTALQASVDQIAGALAGE
jgi:iron complex transport system substrate-binding protein